MNKYILELLRLQKTVILPGFGALSVVNEEKNDIMFMPYLKHDDGKLAEYIAENSNMDEIEAKNSIAKFIREIELELNKGESYDIFQFGVFSKNEDGEIDFEAWSGKKELTSDNTAESNNEDPVFNGDSKKEEAPSVEDVKEEIKEIEKPEIEQKQTFQENKTEVKTETKSISEDKAKKDDDSKTSIFITRDNQPIDKKEELAKNSAKYEKLKSEHQPKAKKNKRGAGFWIAATLLLLIGVGSTIFAINYDEYKEYVPFLASNDKAENENIDSDEPSEFDKMQEMIGNDSSDAMEETSDSAEEEDLPAENNEEEMVEEEPIAEPEVEEIIEPTPVVTSSGKGNYHAIIGAFSNLDNANKLCEELKSEGFPAHVFKNGSLNSVSIQSFETSQEANAKLSQLRERSSSIWIMKRKL